MKFRDYLKEAENDKTEYEVFFRKMLRKYGVESPSELSREDKIKFFDEIDAGWEAENEEPEENDDINEMRGTSLTDKEIKEFSSFMTTNVKWIKDEIKNGHVGDVASMTQSFAIGLEKWVDKLKKSDTR